MKRKIYLDMVLNLIAAGFPLVVLQLVIYPLMAKSLDSRTYGLMIAMYSLMLLVSDSLGRSVNNERLIESNEEENKRGDYNLVIFIFQIINFFAILIGSIYYMGKVEIPYLALIVITSVFMLASAYLLVYYRILLNYIAIVKNAVFLSIGFGIGFLVYKQTGIWICVFLIGQLAQFLYLLCSTKLFGEPLKKTERFNKVFKDSSLLAVSLLLAQGMNLADKLLLFPLLGGAAVSVYYTASLVGKLLSIATGPVNSVILSYLARKESLSKKVFRKYITICTAFCGVLSVGILLLSRPVLGFLFPRFVEEAMILVPYTTASIFFYVMAGMVTPIVMRYCAASWQTIINGISFAIYIGASILLLHFFGIIGFCIGIGISHFLRFIILLIVYNKKAYPDSEDSGKI